MGRTAALVVAIGLAGAAAHAAMARSDPGPAVAQRDGGPERPREQTPEARPGEGAARGVEKLPEGLDVLAKPTVGPLRFADMVQPRDEAERRAVARAMRAALVEDPRFAAGSPRGALVWSLLHLSLPSSRMLWPPLPEQVETMREEIDRAGPGAVESAQALRLLPPAARADFVPGLVGLLDHASFVVVRTAIGALGDVGAPAATAADAPLRPLMEDPAGLRPEMWRASLEERRLLARSPEEADDVPEIEEHEREFRATVMSARIAMGLLEADLPRYETFDAIGREAAARAILQRMGMEYSLPGMDVNGFSSSPAGVQARALRFAAAETERNIAAARRYWPFLMASALAHPNAPAELAAEVRGAILRCAAATGDAVLITKVTELLAREEEAREKAREYIRRNRAHRPAGAP